MKLKKIPAFILFIVVIIFGYLCLQIVPHLLYDNPSLPADCPQYIIDFVKKNPQAQELIDNYQASENSDDINLDKPDGIPLYIQWDKRWAYSPYGQEIVGTAGCGPTCLSMVVVGITNNTTYNPRYISKYAIKNNYLEGSMTRWALLEEGCQDFGIIATGVILDKNAMVKQLNNGHPIIASVRPGDFTSSGHFIVITKYVDGMFIVNDPNSSDNSQKHWTYQQLSKQIKSMWAYSKI